MFIDEVGLVCILHVVYCRERGCGMLWISAALWSQGKKLDNWFGVFEKWAHFAFKYLFS